MKDVAISLGALFLLDLGGIAATQARADLSADANRQTAFATPSPMGPGDAPHFTLSNGVLS